MRLRMAVRAAELRTALTVKAQEPQLRTAPRMFAADLLRRLLGTHTRHDWNVGRSKRGKKGGFVNVIRSRHYFVYALRF